MSAIDAFAGDPTGTTRHSYPASAMVGDYLRAAAGLVPTGVLFATVPLGVVPAVVLGGLAGIFAAFGLRTAMRHGTRIEMNDAGLQMRGARSSEIAWDQLDHMRLAYYSTRRDRSSGWMQLDLGASGRRLRVDSRIDGFDHLVRHAADIAATRGLELNDTTRANLAALGLARHDGGEPR